VGTSRSVQCIRCILQRNNSLAHCFSYAIVHHNIPQTAARTAKTTTSAATAAEATAKGAAESQTAALDLSAMSDELKQLVNRFHFEAGPESRH
jgi:methyl-accepting chemotaxis protein